MVITNPLTTLLFIEEFDNEAGFSGSAVANWTGVFVGVKVNSVDEESLVGIVA